MGIGNKLVLVQVTLFVLSIFLSFFMFIPVSVNHTEFNGKCLLYADGNWNLSSRGRSELIDIRWGPPSACNFTVFMGVVIMLMSLFYTLLGSCYLLRETDSSWLEAFVTMVVCVLILIMQFAASMTVSVGFRHWCDLLTQKQSQIVSCEVADYIPFADEYGINSRNFYTQFSIAGFGCWSLLLVWFVLFCTAALKLWRYRQHESFMSSVNRERQRLLQKVGHGGPSAI